MVPDAGTKGNMQYSYPLGYLTGQISKKSLAFSSQGTNFMQVRKLSVKMAL
jgi:hypothetical protein